MPFIPMCMTVARNDLFDLVSITERVNVVLAIYRLSTGFFFSDSKIVSIL